MSANTQAKALGDLIATLRAKQYKSLREFSIKTGYDPVQTNKWECGVTTPPADRTEHLAEMLGLIEGSEEFNKFIALAKSAREHYVLVDPTEEEIFQKQPGVFRGLKIDEDPDDIVHRCRRIAEDAYRPKIT